MPKTTKRHITLISIIDIILLYLIVVTNNIITATSNINKPDILSYNTKLQLKNILNTNKCNKYAQNIQPKSQQLTTKMQPTKRQLTSKNIHNKSYTFSGLNRPSTIRELAAEEAPEEYIVQPGDTLYDICDQLLDYPEYWPKLWTLNPHIKNPHFIEPGTVLKFYPEDITIPPSLNIVYEDDIVPTVIDTTNNTQTKTLVGKIDLSKIIMDNIIHKQPDFVDISQIQSEEISKEYEIAGIVHDQNKRTVILPSLVYYKKPTPLGTVIGGTFGEVNAGENTKIVINQFADCNIGMLYTILRPTNKIISNKGFIGYRYDFVAHIQIQQKLDHSNYHLAKITHSRLGVNPNDLVFPYISMQRTFSITELSNIVNDSQSSIVGFTYPEQTIGKEGDFIIIDTNHQPGTILPIYQKTSQRQKLQFIKKIPTITHKIGYIQIIENKDNYSLGIVLSNIIDIRIGDTLGNKNKG